MMVTQRHRQTREVRGPDPHSVAIIARAPGRQPPDKLLIERRMKEDQLQLAQELAKQTKIQDLRNDWERSTDRKLQANAIRRRVQTLLHETEFSLEARRERLRDLLESEKAQYMNEAAMTQETTLDRQSRLRERAKQLREKREADRIALVEQKYEQQFREQCEELRTNVSTLQRQEIRTDLQEQMRIKEEQNLEKRQEEEVFHQLWQADIEAKAKREEADARRQSEANRQTVAYLRQQMAALEEKKQQEKRLILEEAQILREEEELRKVEDWKAAELKRRSQLEMKNMLDQTLKVKRIIQARQAQEELAFDLKILEELLKQAKIEESEHEQRKREVREEDRRYREYLRQMKAEEKRREQELERLCDAEVEKMWEKKVQQWKVEAMARQKLLEEVMESRRQQIQMKMASNLSRREEAKKDREVLLLQLAENKRVDVELSEKLRRDINAYRSDLLGQIDYNRRQRESQVDEEKRLDMLQHEAELEYQRKIEYLMNKPVLDKIHPMRRQLYLSAGHERKATPQRGTGSAKLTIG